MQQKCTEFLIFQALLEWKRQNTDGKFYTKTSESMNMIDPYSLENAKPKIWGNLKKFVFF